MAICLKLQGSRFLSPFVVCVILNMSGRNFSSPVTRAPPAVPPVVPTAPPPGTNVQVAPPPPPPEMPQRPFPNSHYYVQLYAGPFTVSTTSLGFPEGPEIYRWRRIMEAWNRSWPDLRVTEFSFQHTEPNSNQPTAWHSTKWFPVYMPFGTPPGANTTGQAAQPSSAGERLDV